MLFLSYRRMQRLHTTEVSWQTSSMLTTIDETLLLGANVKYVDVFLRAVAAVGRVHGLELHEEFQLLQVR